MLTLDQIDDLAEPPLPLPAPTQSKAKVVLLMVEAEPERPPFLPAIWAFYGWTLQPR